MRAFHDPDTRAHRPIYRLSGGILKPSFETEARIDLLLGGLASLGIGVERPEIAVEAALASVHDPRYLDFLREGFGHWSADPANSPELRTSIHANRYMFRRPTDPLGVAGYYQADSSAVLTEGTWTSVLASARSALAAAEVALAGQGAAYALCRPPGHHAYRDQAGGFCYLNNAALVAERAVSRGARVAILDIDVHHGNGTQHIFYDRADVLTVSLHGDPAHLYPFYAGYVDETGRGAGEGYNLNLPLPLASGGTTYAETLQIALQAIRDHGAEFLVIGLGLDAYRGDPFACMALEVGDFRRLGAACRIGLPTVILQEGGYPSDGLGTVLAAFLDGFAS